MRTRVAFVLSLLSIAGAAACGSGSPSLPKPDAGSTVYSGAGNGAGAAANSGISTAGASGHAATVSLPTDGNQLSLCTMAQGDCNKGYACYAPATATSSGRGFCSKLCSIVADCTGLTPTSVAYACSSGATQVCDIPCRGVDDTASCPSNMICVQTAGGGNRTPAQFRCMYPLEQSPAWGPCADGMHACAAGLECYRASLSHPGYCTTPCNMDSDCTTPPTSGSIAPSCATIMTSRNSTTTVKRCVLDCSSARDACPDGQMCVDGPRSLTTPSYSRCEYP